MDFNPQSYAPDGTAIFAKDDQLLIKFFRHPELSQIKSKANGVPVYDDVDMISVIQPGEKEEVKVVATDMHKRRFPKQWEAYKSGQDQAQSGTPLDHLFPAEPGAVLTLRAFNVFTVQQLANLSDTAMINIPMGRTLADKAKAYLASASAGQNFHTMQDSMQRQIDALKAALAERGVEAPETPASPEPEARQKRAYNRKETA